MVDALDVDESNRKVSSIRQWDSGRRKTILFHHIPWALCNNTEIVYKMCSKQLFSVSVFKYEMDRHRFLGTTDLSIVRPLLTNYNVPTRIPGGIKLNKVKHHDDLTLIELGTLLTPNECDELLSNIREEMFEDMSIKYDAQKRTSSRIIVMDDRLGRTLWRRLKFSNRLTKLLPHPTPLGFNVQGEWIMSGVNPAMRINKYKDEDYFSPHKDAQYAPSGDERSLLSLLIYLNDDYEKGETKFYFPKQASKSDVKGLTIAEEIESYGGLVDGYECIALKPKKGFAVLFTHNLLHEATSPEMSNASPQTERLVLRTDVLVKRKGKPLGFAICPEENEDYLACLNFFREAQQMELMIAASSKLSTGEFYERSLSIRYCYPRLLQAKLKQSVVDKDQEKALIDRLPPELWLRIFKYLHEQDIHHLIFAFPPFQLLKIVWEGRVTRDFVTDPSRPKYLPTISTQYGSRTLFSFTDSDFFYRHIDGCCRVVAVYAFFLLGHGKDCTSYIVRYDKNTHEVCEVQMEMILADAFYNRNCYGSLYRVEQKDKIKRQPKVDLDHSVDRTYFTNRHQAQFIGQNLLARFHYQMRDPDVTRSDIYGMEEYDDFDPEEHHPVDRSTIQIYERQHVLCDEKNQLVDHEMSSDDLEETKEPICSYAEHLLNSDAGSSLFRMISAKDHFIDLIRVCPIRRCKLSKVRNLIRYYNHLVFDFDTHHLIVERLSDEKLFNEKSNSLLRYCLETLQNSNSNEHPIEHYRVNIEQLAKETKGFNHASFQSSYPAGNIDQFSFLDYTHLSHVSLAITENSDKVFVLAMYGGIVAL